MAVYKLALLSALAGLFVGAVAQTDDKPAVRVRSIPESQIVRKVDPEYPANAIRNRIQGAVTLSVAIAMDGHIEQVRVVSGHPLLRRAAQQAVQQWIYRPQLLGGKPVRVSTQVTVHFLLDRQGRPMKVESNSAPVIPV